MNIRLNNNAFTLLELTMAVAFSTFLMAGVFGFYNASNQSYFSGVSGQNLQSAANILLKKIMEGETESGTVYRLATASSYMIPNGASNALYTCGGAPQVVPCNANNPSSELYFCYNPDPRFVDSPCVGSSDPNARWYYLNSAGTSVIYHHPNPNGGGTIEENIYTAPANSTLKLRFTPPPNPPYVGNPSNVVEVDVDLTGNVSPNITNNRLITSGDVSTYILLRNHP